MKHHLLKLTPTFFHLVSTLNFHFHGILVSGDLSTTHLGFSPGKPPGFVEFVISGQVISISSMISAFEKAHQWLWPKNPPEGMDPVISTTVDG